MNCDMLDMVVSRVRGYLCNASVHAKAEHIAHKIKASKGFLGPVSRAQVKDLWGSDGDGAVTPTDRVPELQVEQCMLLS